MNFEQPNDPWQGRLHEQGFTTPYEEIQKQQFLDHLFEVYGLEYNYEIMCLDDMDSKSADLFVEEFKRLLYGETK